MEEAARRTVDGMDAELEFSVAVHVCCRACGTVPLQSLAVPKTSKRRALTVVMGVYINFGDAVLKLAEGLFKE